MECDWKKRMKRRFEYHQNFRLFAFHFYMKQGREALTLNVWSCNESALRFYEKCGLLPQKIGMEKIL